LTNFICAGCLKSFPIEQSKLELWELPQGPTMFLCQTCAADPKVIAETRGDIEDLLKNPSPHFAHFLAVKDKLTKAEREAVLYLLGIDPPH
jgi:hypothetical protein